MKKAKFLLMLLAMVVLATGFTACSDDKDNDEPQVPVEEVDPLIGTWRQDDDVAPYILTFSSNNTGSVQFTIDGNAAPSRVELTVRQNFKWSKGVDSDGRTYVNILTTSGDDILDDGRYVYTIIGTSMQFGGLRFTKY